MPEQRDILEEIMADAARRARVGLSDVRASARRSGELISRFLTQTLPIAAAWALVGLTLATAWLLDLGERAVRAGLPPVRRAAARSLTATIAGVAWMLDGTEHAPAAFSELGQRGRRAGRSLGTRARDAAARLRDGAATTQVGSTRTSGVVASGSVGIAVGVIAVVAAITLFFTVLLTPALVAAAHVVSQAHEHVDAVPPLPEVIDRPAERSRVLAADGTEIAVWAEENRRIVPLDDIPEVTKEAVLAIEDIRFFDHEGVDVRATGRALLANVRAGDVAEGGSTITQQYVKNSLLTADETIERKIVEAMYATELERRWGKAEILEAYLNVIYLGNGVYGFAAGAEFYFGKDVGELELHESALLAGIIANPSRFDPIERPDQARARRDLVLSRMVEHDLISDREAAGARAVDVAIEPNPLPEPTYPFFVEYVKQLLLDDDALGDDRVERADALYRGGLEITTTLDPAKQEAALAAIGDHLGDGEDGPLGAIVSLEPASGEVRTLAIGPREFGVCPEEDDGICPTMQVNPLVPGMGGSGRQTGSAFKPFVVAAALEQGFTTSHTIPSDSETEIDGCGAPGETWEPRNFDEADPGTIDMVTAVRNSNNVYHAELIAEIGPAAAVEMAQRLGFTTELPEVCALALGSADVFPIEKASAVSTFANGGTRCDPLTVTSVVDHDGGTILEPEPSCEEGVLDGDVVATINALHREVVRSGTGAAANIGRDVAGKTGTTNDFRDAWFSGWVPQLATVTWVGFDEPTEMRGILGHSRITGGTVPAAMFRTYMRAALDGVEEEQLSSTDLTRANTDDD